jgi:gliding motility-associated-like protein
VIIIGSVEFPTAFTPDNDSKNDYWEIRNIDKLYPENIVKIFNRWGNLVYESEKGAYANKPWNGKLNDENLPIGSYYFVIEYNSSKKSDKGTVTIIR